MVTNKHVVASAEKGAFYFTMADENGVPIIGTAHRLEITDQFANIWYGHRDKGIDVTVTPLAPLLKHVVENTRKRVFVPPIGHELIPTEKAMDELDAIETITFIGYPNGIWDTKNFLPIVRRGITATPIAVDFRGKKQFLIDASVFPGSSGSPVFILNVGMHTNKFGVTRVASRIFFLGVVSSVFFKRDINEIKMISQPVIDIPVAISKEMIDLGLVFKATTIVETIEGYLHQHGFGDNNPDNT